MPLPPPGEVPEVADGDRSAADLGGADRVLPRADALEPVPEVARCLVELYLSVADFLVPERFGFESKEAAVDLDLAVRPREAHTVRTSVVDGNPVRR